MTPDKSSFRRERSAVWALGLGVWLAFGCRSKADVERAVPEPPTTPDRLTPEEQLPEAETAFGLPIPAGMRLARHFSDAAYFAGELTFDRALEHIKRYVEARELQMVSRGAVFARAYIKGDESRRVFRIEISETPRGSQVHIKNITPPPATKGASEADLWSRAGRKPDGTPIDQSQLY